LGDGLEPEDAAAAKFSEARKGILETVDLTERINLVDREPKSRHIWRASHSAGSLFVGVPAQLPPDCLFTRILDDEQHTVRIHGGLVRREDARQRSVRPQFALLE